MIAWLVSSAFAGGWREDVASSVAACRTEPAPCAAADAIVLRRTRAGYLIAQDDRLDDPAVVGPLLGRLLGETDPAVGAGLADAFVETMQSHPDSPWSAAWIELAAVDPRPEVRSVLVNAMRRAPIQVAGPGLRGALSGGDPATRRDAVATMSGHARAAEFAPELVAALDDPDAGVRGLAARGLRWLRDPAHRDVLLAHAQDPDAQVRTEIDRALEALTPSP